MQIITFTISESYFEQFSQRQTNSSSTSMFVDFGRTSTIDLSATRMITEVVLDDSGAADEMSLSFSLCDGSRYKVGGDVECGGVGNCG